MRMSISMRGFGCKILLIDRQIGEAIIDEDRVDGVLEGKDFPERVIKLLQLQRDTNLI